MKKFVAVCVICCSLLFLKSPFVLSELSQNYEGTYTFYSLENLQDSRVDVVKSGNGYLLSCDTSVAGDIYKTLNQSSLQGESFCFRGDRSSAFKIIEELSANVLKAEDFGGIYIVYAYTQKLLSSTLIGGEKVNIQIAVNKNLVTVGTPLILGGY